MASSANKRLRRRIVLSATALALAAGCAGLSYPSARALLLTGLVAMIAARVLWRSINELRDALEMAMAPPAAAPADALAEALRIAELRLELAPIALFLMELPDGRPQAFNNAARRMLSPGRCSDPQQLCAVLAEQRPGQRSLISFDSERGSERAQVAVSAVAMQGRHWHWLALMPIESTLEAEVMHAWRELVRVLTHEIMNSLTPVASLSESAGEILLELEGSMAAPAHADLTMALDAIGRRANGLLDFVAAYRSMANTPEAFPERIVVAQLFQRLDTLLGPQWRARGGQLDCQVSSDALELMADPGQLEQALINLLKNAAEATADLPEPKASMRARLVRGGRLCIEIMDNGSGVPAELIGHIFTPFFSTKDKGSGIGLAMVRQLIHANGGTVRYAHSTAGGARFLIVF